MHSGPNAQPKKTWRTRVDSIIVWGNRQPILTIRRVVWIITAGWWLALAYLFFSLSLVLTIIFIPFVPQAIKLAWFAFDPTTLESVRDDQRFRKPFTIAANVVWALLFGWGLFLGFVLAAFVQVLTIVGIPTALTFINLGKFILLPFGNDIRKKFLPTTVAELQARHAGQPAGAGDTEGAPRAQGGAGRLEPLADRSSSGPTGPSAV